MSKKIKEIILHKSMKDSNFAKEILTQLPSKLFEESPEMKSVYTVLKRASHTSTKLSSEALAVKLEDFMIKDKKSSDEVTNAISYLDSLYAVPVDQADESLNTEVGRYIKTELSKDVLSKFIAEDKINNSDNLTELVTKLKQIEISDISGTDGEFIDFFNDTDKKKEYLSTISSNKFPTGFKSLDKHIEGGIARGEVGLIIAKTGGGKSLTASNLAKNYVRDGLNVLYVALEEKMDRMVLRAEQQILGVDKKSLLKEDMSLNIDVYNILQEKYKQNRAVLGNYYISKHMPQQVSPTKLEQIIVDTTIKKGVHIDVVIIDYPQLMRNPFLNTSSEHDAMGKLYEEIRRLAQQYEFICWTLAQTNRSAHSADIVTAEHVEGSRKILNAVEVAVVVNQKDEEFKNGYMRLYLDKVRNSSNTGEKFVHLKVEVPKMRLRDESPEEFSEHMSILSSRVEDGEDKSRFKKQDNKRELVNNTFAGVSLN